MKKVKHLGVLVILGALSLSGIAFSSWVSTEGNKLSFNVETSVGNLNNLSNIFEVSSFKTFEYNSEGFINEDKPNEVSLSRAVINTVIKYNVKNAKATYKNLNDLTLYLNYSHLYNENVTSNEVNNNLYLNANNSFTYLNKVNLYFSGNNNFVGLSPTIVFNHTYKSNSNNGCSILINELNNSYLIYDICYLKVEQIFNVPFNFNSEQNSIIKNLSNSSFTLSLDLKEDIN